LAQPATEERKRRGWEMAVRKILCTVLHEAHKQQIEEAMDMLSEGPGGFYKAFTTSKKSLLDPIGAHNSRAAFSGLDKLGNLSYSHV
jgi:hypothetical protein